MSDPYFDGLPECTLAGDEYRAIFESNERDALKNAEERPPDAVTLRTFVVLNRLLFSPEHLPENDEFFVVVSFWRANDDETFTAKPPRVVCRPADEWNQLEPVALLRL